MANLNFNKVTALPGVLSANAFYLVVNGAYAETYVTDSAGVAKSLGNSAMINTLADARIATALVDRNLIEIAATIAARDAMAAGAQRNLLVLVEDATGDATVAAGAALYAWKEASGTWSKITEYESADVVLAWANISGKPGSSPSQIDDAVTKRHSHANQTQLDKIGESGGQLTYDGQPVAAAWSTNNW
jgi:predicted NodU family carbamoyl transferase